MMSDRMVRIHSVPDGYEEGKESSCEDLAAGKKLPSFQIAGHSPGLIGP
jgi:hypothetical protein